MRAIYEMAQPNWQRLRQQPTIGTIADGLREIPDADGEHMGWGVLGLCALLDNVRDQGRWAGRGMITQLTGELPGLELTQAGVALLTCGGFHLSQGMQVGVNEATRGFLRTRRKAAEGMTYAGIGLAGALMALSGDACLARG
jgi:hypothetical protein